MTRSPLLRKAAWLAAGVLLLVGVWARQRHSQSYIENTAPKEQGKRGEPALRGRGVPETQAPTGEAEARPGETWFKALSLEALIADEEPELIVGQVLDTEGKPVYGISVSAALDDDGPPDPAWEGSGGYTTGEDGMFVLGGLPDRTFRLTAERERVLRRDWRKGRPTSEMESGWAERVVVEDVRAGRRDVRIRVAAVPDGETEWQAKIRVIGPDGKDVPAWSYTECSDEAAWSSIEGKVEAEPGRPGIVFFTGRPPFGLIITGPATKDWEPLPFAPGFLFPIEPREEPYVVHLKRAGSIRGRVDLLGDEPTANVLVRYAVLSSGRAEDPERITADVKEHGAFMWDVVSVEEDGSFAFENLPPGRVRLIPLHHEEALPEKAPNSAGRTVSVGETGVRLRLPAHAAIEGLLDSEAVAGVTGVTVHIQVSRLQRGRPLVSWSGGLPLRELRAVGGRFETGPLPKDAVYTLDVWAEGILPGRGQVTGWLARRRVERVRPGGSPVYLVLRALPAIRGRVEAADGSLPGALLEVHAIRASAHALALTRSLERGPLEEPLVDSLVGGFDVGWRAAVWAPLVLPPADHTPFFAMTDKRGAFVFPGLPPGSYILWTRGPHGAAILRNPPAMTGSEDVLLVLRHAKRISGRVRFDGGPPPPGFVVEARRSRGLGPVVVSSEVRADGYFQLGDLADGDYHVSAYNARDPEDGRSVAHASIPAGTKRLLMVLAKGAAISGTVVDDRGGRTGGAEISVRSASDARRALVGRGGVFRVAGLVGSEHVVRVVLPDGRSAEVSVSAGATDLRILVR